MVLRRFLQRQIASEIRRRSRPLCSPAFDLAACSCPATALRHKPWCTFPQARAFIEDLSDLVVVLCGRRSGKSSAGRQLVVKTALANPGRTLALVGPTRVATKKLHWDRLQALLRDAGVPFTKDGTDLILKLFNGAQIWLAGAKDTTEVERLRGPEFVLVVVDECGVIRPSILKYLVEDVLQWSLVDYAGRLVLMGTPPPVPAGYFVERYRGLDAHNQPVKGWSRHGGVGSERGRWTLFENSLLPNRSVAEYLRKLREDRGLTEQSITWRREVLGELVYDKDALVLNAFDLDHSVWSGDALPEGTWRYVLGVDIGWHDPDAIVVLGWCSSSPNLYVVEEYEKPHQTEEDLAEVLRGFINRYHPLSIVGDTGGGGKKTLEGISRRIKWIIKPAHKPSIVEQFNRLNDEFRAGKLFVPAGGNCAEDAIRMMWEPGKTGQKVAHEPHSDALPALSYAYPEARHFFYNPPVDDSAERERAAKPWLSSRWSNKMVRR